MKIDPHLLEECARAAHESARALMQSTDPKLEVAPAYTDLDEAHRDLLRRTALRILDRTQPGNIDPLMHAAVNRAAERLGFVYEPPAPHNPEGQVPVVAFSRSEGRGQ